MKRKPKTVFAIIIFIILSFIAIILIQNDTPNSLYGFIEISDKKVIEKEFFDDEYQLQMRVGDVERVIVMNKSDRLTFGADLNSTEECEVQLENIWDKIETDEWYFMRVDKKSPFSNNFEIIYFNPNVPYNGQGY